MHESDDSDYEFEPTSSFGAPFCQMLPAELLDSRLTYGARLLIAWLRFRIGARNYSSDPSTNIKVETLATDFGCNKKTMTDWLKQLEDIGLLVRVRRGNGQTDKKILVDPLKVYGPDRVHNVYDYLRRNENGETMVKYLNSHDTPKTGVSDSDNPKNGSSGTEQTTQKMGRQDNPKNGSSKVTTLKAPTDYLKEQEEPASQVSPGDPDEDSGNSLFPKKKNKVSKTNKGFFASRRDIPEDFADSLVADQDDESRIATVRDLMDRAATNAQDYRDAKRRQRMAADPLKQAEARERKREAKLAQQRDADPTARTVEQWWREQHRDHHSGVPCEKWSVRRLGEAKKLLETYGPGPVQTAFRHLFDNWESYRQQYKWKQLGPVPNFDFLFWDRDNLMPRFVIQSKAKKPDVVSGDATIDDSDIFG